MVSKFELHTLSELAALRQLVVRLLAHAGLQAKIAGFDHDDYLQMLMEASMRDIDLAEFPDLPEESASAIREMAKQRLGVIVTGAGARTPSVK